MDLKPPSMRLAFFIFIPNFRVLIVLCLVAALPYSLLSQQLEIRRSRGTGSFMTFSEWKDWSVAWNQRMKSGAKYGISFDYALKTLPYSWVHESLNYQTGISKTYVENRDPYNQRFAATLFVGWCPLQSDKAAIYWGPTLSLNWLKINEKTHQHGEDESVSIFVDLVN